MESRNCRQSRIGRHRIHACSIEQLGQSSATRAKRRVMLCTGLGTGCADTPALLCAAWGHGCGKLSPRPRKWPPGWENVLPRLCKEDFLTLEERIWQPLVIHTRNLTSNVTPELCRARAKRPLDPPICQARESSCDYSSSMCSKASPHEPAPLPVATALSRAIDELAAVAGAGDDAELAGRLAGAWAMIAAADPELAARTEKYSRSRGPRQAHEAPGRS
jgi:hypothetical protein